eukprot:2861335-Amphidinium_carterae.1
MVGPGANPGAAAAAPGKPAAGGMAAAMPGAAKPCAPAMPGAAAIMGALRKTLFTTVDNSPHIP